jgi:hypothetical protein
LSDYLVKSIKDDKLLIARNRIEYNFAVNEVLNKKSEIIAAQQRFYNRNYYQNDGKVFYEHSI